MRDEQKPVARVGETALTPPERATAPTVSVPRYFAAGETRAEFHGAGFIPLWDGDNPARRGAPIGYIADREDALRITRYCNHHDALVNVLKRARHFVLHCADVRGFGELQLAEIDRVLAQVEE